MGSQGPHSQATGMPAFHPFNGVTNPIPLCLSLYYGFTSSAAVTACLGTLRQWKMSETSKQMPQILREDTIALSNYIYKDIHMEKGYVIAESQPRHTCFRHPSAFMRSSYQG